ncbi:hypothetical protein HII31_07063 [Pseudocercospora fuligena]|uniref:Uncharacterized protein n=1 Tax=Pseudocercospora fuligena TaxID=685502 RepID=A0A8H6RI92_9PEZI|nr:hypothetical protein HII31_07063 [Pseudocercospora fuligena]
MPMQTPHPRKMARRDASNPLTIPLPIWRKARQKHTYFKFTPYEALGDERSKAERDQIIDSIRDLSGQHDPIACIPRTVRDDAKGNRAKDCSASFLRFIENCVVESRHRLELSDRKERNSILPRPTPINDVEKRAANTSSEHQLGVPTPWPTYEAKFEDEVRESSGRKRSAARSAKARLAAYGSYNSSNKQIDTDDDYTEGDEDDNDDDEIEVKPRSRTSSVAEHNPNPEPSMPTTPNTSCATPQPTLFISPPPTTTTPSVCFSDVDRGQASQLYDADSRKRKRMLDIEDMELELKQIRLRKELKEARLAEERELEEEMGGQ